MANALMHAGVRHGTGLQVTTPKYAESDTFARQLLDNPITLVRGLVTAIGFDLSVFASAALASEHGNDRIEVRRCEGWDRAHMHGVAPVVTTWVMSGFGLSRAGRSGGSLGPP